MFICVRVKAAVGFTTVRLVSVSLDYVPSVFARSAQMATTVQTLVLENPTVYVYCVPFCCPKYFARCDVLSSP